MRSEKRRGNAMHSYCEARRFGHRLRRVRSEVVKGSTGPAPPSEQTLSEEDGVAGGGVELRTTVQRIVHASDDLVDRDLTITIRIARTAR